MNELSLNTTLGPLEIMSAIGSFIVIILILAGAFYASRWYAKKMNNGGFSGGGKYVKIIDRVGLGQYASLAIVEVCSKYYFVGISERNIQMLCEIPDFEAFMSENPQVKSSEPFAAMLRSFMDKAHPKADRDDGGEK